jgi:hypothetical protein
MVPLAISTAVQIAYVVALVVVLFLGPATIAEMNPCGETSQGRHVAGRDDTEMPRLSGRRHLHNVDPAECSLVPAIGGSSEHSAPGHTTPVRLTRL